MKVTLEFGSHHYIHEYEKCDYFCPACGKQTVWEEQGSGDYYEGVDYVCTSCNHSFTIPSLKIADSAWALIPEQLRSGIALKPVSKVGN